MLRWYINQQRRQTNPTGGAVKVARNRNAVAVCCSYEPTHVAAFLATPAALTATMGAVGVAVAGWVGDRNSNGCDGL